MVAWSSGRLSADQPVPGPPRKVQPLAAMYSWILIWPLSFLAHRAGGRRPADLEPAGD